MERPKWPVMSSPVAVDKCSEDNLKCNSQGLAPAVGCYRHDGHND